MVGWRRFRVKGGLDPQFNCNKLVLTTADLDALEQTIRNAALPHTTGFFFGASEPEDMSDDLDFVAKARKAINEGKTVFYDSWW